jgi:hypothetical protein
MRFEIAQIRICLFCFLIFPLVMKALYDLIWIAFAVAVVRNLISEP